MSELKIKKEGLYDVSGIGSALLDITVEVDDTVLTELGLVKGEMDLIDEERSKSILSAIENYARETTPGGSSANTLAGVATFNGKSFFMGKVGSDENGDIYITETEKAGVISALKRHDRMTGHAITFITPDRERSFATHLGAAVEFAKADVDEEGIKNSKILHLEGYLFEPEGLREACFHAMDIARGNGVLVSVDLSDAGLISRIRDVFDVVIKDQIDIVFANEDEAEAFTGKKPLDAVNALAGLCSLAVVKTGAEGSLIKTGSMSYNIDPVRAEVVNTNGAGDMYAAGLLYGLAAGMGPDRAGKLGSHGASLVVSQVSTRLAQKIAADDVLS